MQQFSLSLNNQKNQLLIFHHILQLLFDMYKMETQKIVNLSNASDNESSKFATRKSSAINDQNNTEYGEGNENDSSIKFETKLIKANLCDYSDSFILLTGYRTITGGNTNIRVAFKNCAPVPSCVTHVNYEHIDTA